MTSKDLCNSVYKDLCAQIGELSLKKSLLQTELNSISLQISKLESQIPLLNALAGELDKANGN
jgi:hypothetical protein